MYDLLAFHSKPVYGWQYVSGTLMHGSKGAPAWFLWVHLILNGLMILPFGGLLERKRGSIQVLIVFVTATVLSSIVFHFLTHGQDIQATGISAVGYAFVTGGVMLLPNVWKEFSRTVKWLYLFLIFLSGLMLLPAITGWISTLLHLSGIVSYLLVFIGSKGFEGKELTIKTAPQYGFHRTSLTLPLPAPVIIFYINEENHLLSLSKGDFITVKRETQWVYLYNQNSCSALSFSGIFVDLALHDFELSKIWFGQ